MSMLWRRHGILLPVVRYSLSLRPVRSVSTTPFGDGDAVLIKKTLAGLSTWQDVHALWQQCTWASNRTRHVRERSVFHGTLVTSPTNWQEREFCEKLQGIFASQSKLDEVLDGFVALPWPLNIFAGEKVVELAIQEAQKTRDGSQLVETVHKIFRNSFILTPKLKGEQVNDLAAITHDLWMTEALDLDQLLKLYWCTCVSSVKQTVHASSAFWRLTKSVEKVTEEKLDSFSVENLSWFVRAVDRSRIPDVAWRVCDRAFEHRDEMELRDVILMVRNMVYSYNFTAGDDAVRGMRAERRQSLERWVQYADEVAAPHLHLLDERYIDALCNLFARSSYAAVHCQFIQFLHDRHSALYPSVRLAVLQYAVTYLNIPIQTTVAVMESICAARDVGGSSHGLSTMLPSDLSSCSWILGHNSVMASALGQNAVMWEPLTKRHGLSDDAAATAASLRTIGDMLMDEIFIGRRPEDFSCVHACLIVRHLTPWACASSKLEKFLPRFASTLKYAGEKSAREYQEHIQASSDPMNCTLPLHGGPNSKSLPHLMTLDALLNSLFWLSVIQHNVKYKDVILPALNALLAVAKVMTPKRCEASGVILTLQMYKSACVSFRNLAARNEEWLAGVCAYLMKLHSSGHLFDSEHWLDVCNCIYTVTVLDVALPLPVYQAVLDALTTHRTLLQSKNESMRMLWCVAFPGGRSGPLADRHVLRSFVHDLVRHLADQQQSVSPTIPWMIKQVAHLTSGVDQPESPNSSTTAGGVGAPAAAVAAANYCTKGPVTAAATKVDAAAIAAAPHTAKVDRRQQVIGFGMVSFLRDAIGPFLSPQFTTDQGIPVATAFCLDSNGNMFRWQRNEMSAAAKTLGVKTPAGTIQVAVLLAHPPLRLHNSDYLLGRYRATLAILEANGWHCLCVPASSLRTASQHQLKQAIQEAIVRLHRGRDSWCGYHDYLAMCKSMRQADAATRVLASVDDD